MFQMRRPVVYFFEGRFVFLWYLVVAHDSLESLSLLGMIPTHGDYSSIIHVSHGLISTNFNLLQISVMLWWSWSIVGIIDGIPDDWTPRHRAAHTNVFGARRLAQFDRGYEGRGAIIFVAYLQVAIWWLADRCVALKWPISSSESLVLLFFIICCVFAKLEVVEMPVVEARSCRLRRARTLHALEMMHR